MNKKELGSYAFMMVFALVIIGNSLTFQYMSAKVGPIIIGGLILALAAGGFIKEWRKAKSQPVTATAGTQAGTTSEGNKREKKLRDFLIGCGWFVAFFFAIYLVGFIISGFVFQLAYMKSQKRKWLSSLVVTGVTTAIVYVGFVVLLQTELFTGILFGGRI